MTDGPMIRREDWGISHRELMCEPLRVTYDFVTRHGELHMADGDCCDMIGCIDFFTRMDQDAKKIATFSGNKPDTVYVRGDNGKWRARR